MSCTLVIKAPALAVLQLNLTYLDTEFAYDLLRVYATDITVEANRNNAPVRYWQGLVTNDTMTLTFDHTGETDGPNLPGQSAAMCAVH